MFKKSSELSSSIEQDFRADHITQCGFSGEVTAMAYDPVQGLYAVGTDTGMVHVMGAGEIRAVMDTNPAHKTPSVPIHHLRFMESVYLVSIDERSLIIVWALDSQQEWVRYQSAMGVLSLWTDPAMDWLFMGHHNGEITAFDVDRGKPTYFKIQNLERLVNPKITTGSVFAMSLHPRDPSQLLICYRTIAVVWNLVKNEIMYDLHYEFPFTNAVWHPSGSHIASTHVNGFVMFWDGTKGVKLGARNAFPSQLEKLDISTDRVPEGLAWCCKEDPTDTYLLVWGGKSMTNMEFGPTPTVATSSYEAMGNFFKSDNINQSEIYLPHAIKLTQVMPQLGNPHYQGCYNPSNIVVLSGTNIVSINLPHFNISPFVSSSVPTALSWRAYNITCFSTCGITRNQWIGMMAAALPNPKIVGGSSATQQIRKLQLATVMCLGYADGSVRLYDATRADSRDYRVVATSISGLNIDDQTKAEGVSHISLGAEAGEMAIASNLGNVYLCYFGKNRRLTEPGPPAPAENVANIEHLNSPQLHQGFIPQWQVKTNGAKVTALCQSNIGFVAIGYDNGLVQVIDKRGPAVIMQQTIKGLPTKLEFGICTVDEEEYSSILLGIGTTRGEVLLQKIVPRQEGGFQVLPTFQNLSIGKDPITELAFVDMGKGKSAIAEPETMGRLAGAFKVTGGLLASTVSDARFYSITGPKSFKKLGSKSFDTPLAACSFAYLRWGSSLALVTVNIKGKCGIYGLPGLATLCSYQAPTTPVGPRVTVSEMGDAFLPYNEEAVSGQVIRIFGTENFPKPDDLYSSRKKVPARPTISTVHWMVGRQFVKPSDLDNIIGGNRRGKSKRVRAHLVDDAPFQEPEIPNKPQPTKSGSNAWFGNKKMPTFTHPKPKGRVGPQKTWGKTIHEYYESAEGTVNDALDEAMSTMTQGGQQAQSSVTRGLFGKAFGL